VVDEDEVGIERMSLLGQFLGLARADEITRIGALDARGQAADDARASRTREFGELGQRLRIGLPRRLRLQQQRAFAFSGSLEQRNSPNRK
jgi:hypothetical protein